MMAFMFLPLLVVGAVAFVIARLLRRREEADKHVVLSR
jgi:hypothetical protein